jgi:hypothetical protein
MGSMGRVLPILATTALLAALVSPSAHAARPQVLVDAAPAADPAAISLRLLDHGLRAHRARAARAAASRDQVIGTPDGQSVRVVLAPSYHPDPAVPSGYVAFLGSLPHGSELSRLRVVIAPPAEVSRTCGSRDSVACYGDDTMVVPGEAIAASTGLTTSYAIAHEYGHHVAAHRSNAPFSALDTGPKRWSSYERVCVRTSRGLLAPGNERSLYRANPGEAWAETYAHLTYPRQAWAFTPLLRPDAGALRAAALDVGAPWRRPAARTLSGAFPASGSNVRSFNLPISLDGTFDARLDGPARSNLDLALLSRGRRVGRTTTAGSADRLHFGALCRESGADSATLRVTRRSGAGAFRVVVRSAG